MRNLISLLLSGLVVGVLARFFYPGDVDMGLGRTILLGIGGALVVGLLASWRSGEPLGREFNRAGCLASVLGAIVLILLGRALL